MTFSLIICTYMRPQPLFDLLKSVQGQSPYPDEIVIVDGSLNDATEKMIRQNPFENLRYFLVDAKDRGLTKQRNFGIAHSADVDVICFLDDDTILEKDYFKNLIGTYDLFPDARGVGGYITNEMTWKQLSDDYIPDSNEFIFDGFARPEGVRFELRKKLGLDSDKPPGFMPESGHGRSVGFLPPSGKIYEVEQFMGGVSSFRKSVFKDFSFSTFFEGYGLYEDADFTLRLSETGKLYVNTAARLEHHHHESGRPNRYNYGKMVVRNGWYVWRVKHRNPKTKAIIKWHLTTLLLIAIRFLNAITTSKRREAFTEAAGRLSAWIALLFKSPRS